jgi:sugar (pentulose or hexulose) kinase
MDYSKHVLAVDVGSSSVRCSLYDGTGRFVKGTGASSPHAFAITRDGEATQNADVLCGLVFEAIDETLGRAGESGRNRRGCFEHVLAQRPGR